jgi:hypothetical protein
MSHPWAPDASLWRRLLKIDQETAARIRKGGCRHCGGPLHRADYPRKPRGALGAFEAAFCTRLSFCCGHCRRRTTPPSVRFLGRKVYVGELVLRASVALQTLKELGRAVLGVPARTVRRWLCWWREGLTSSSFWKVTRALFMPPLNESALPASLLERFAESDAALGVRALAFMAPVTTGSSSNVRVDVTHAEDGAW